MNLKNIESYVCGEWYFGSGPEAILNDSYTGESFCRVNSQGIDFKEVSEYGRGVGRKILANMSFPRRGLMLKTLASFLMKHKEEFYELSYRTGATRKDSWIDIEGGIGNLFSYASFRKNFPEKPFLAEGDEISLSKNQSFSARHVLVPKEGLAVHINAYNFPVWGMLEKIAVNLLAGVPAVVKPATASCYLTESVVRKIIESKILPEGCLQLICGSVGDLFDHLDFRDTITFTGSFETGSKLKNHPKVLAESIHFNMEADSLNSIILGDDVEPGKDPEFDLFIREITRELTVKCGQKCTAIRRIIVPESKTEAVIEALDKKLASVSPGDPRSEKTRMGCLISRDQAEDVTEKIQMLRADSELVFGNPDEKPLGKAAALSPILLYNSNPESGAGAHRIEAFGPAATVMPYDSLEEAVNIGNYGKGSLCCSVVTANPENARRIVLGCGFTHGRIYMLNDEIAKTGTGHGSPLPNLIHGGPGRAGNGEEMGGMLGIKHYMQRFALQGSPTMLSAVTGTYHTAGKIIRDDKHPFSKFFEDLQIGETLITHKRTFTEADISNFSNLTWDHFHAHTDHTSLEDTIFERPVVHGYLVLSAAAGLFVDPRKGNVLLNYGLENCRFIKPLYAGDTIHVHLTVKDKIPRERKNGDIYPQGIVKFLVIVRDQNEEDVAVATILTMVRAREELMENS